MEHELMNLCKDLVNALTKDNYELVKRFVEMEAKFEDSLPTPEKLKDVSGVGKKPKNTKEHKPKIVQGDLPWNTENESISPHTKTDETETDPFKDLPF